MPNATMIEAHESKGVQGGLYRAPRKTLWWAWLLTACLAGWGATSSNGLLTSGAVIALAVAIQLLWRNEEVPVLVFALGMQWLQASAAIFYTDLNGLSLAGEFGSQQIVIASWLSLIAVVVLAIAIRIALLRSPNDLRTTVQRSAKRIDVVRSFVVYAISCVIATFVMQFAWAVPSFTQILLPLAAVKWAFVFILAYAVFEQRNGYGYLIAAVAIEFFIGAIGFFSDFKSVFFVVTVACLSSRFALRGRRLVLLVLIFAILLSTGVLWSAIKTEYRDYVNGGTGQQTVTVPVEERVFKLGDLVSRFNATDINNGLDAMILRVSYVYYFALAMVNVPDAVPYENGALWGGAIRHVFMPRLFFPDKGAIDDSERTAMYTGMSITSAEKGTSISIGYVGESYIDYGPVWMFGPIFGLGLLYGVIFRIFAMRKRYAALGNAMGVAILIFNAYTIETSNIKLVGNSVTACLVFGALYLSFGRAISAWLKA